MVLGGDVSSMLRRLRDLEVFTREQDREITRLHARIDLYEEEIKRLSFDVKDIINDVNVSSGKLSCW